MQNAVGRKLEEGRRETKIFLPKSELVADNAVTHDGMMDGFDLILIISMAIGRLSRLALH